MMYYRMSLFPVLVQPKSTVFFSDWDKGISGIVKGDCPLAKNNFAMKMLALVEGESCTGYLAEVIREIDKKIRCVKTLILYFLE